MTYVCFHRTRTSRRCVSRPSRLTSSTDTWWTGSWSRRTQPVPARSCEPSWKGWSESLSGCPSAGSGPKLTPRLTEELHNQPAQNLHPSSPDTLKRVVCPDSRKLKHQRKRTTSQNTSLSGVLQQNSWPEKSQSSSHLKSGLVWICWLTSEDKADEGKGSVPGAVTVPGEGSHSEDCSVSQLLWLLLEYLQ